MPKYTGRGYITKLLIPLVMAFAVAIYAYFDINQTELVLKPKYRPLRTEVTNGHATIVKTGWSVAPTPDLGVKEALDSAIGEGVAIPLDFVMLYVTQYSRKEMQQAVRRIRKRCGQKTRVYAGDSFDNRVLTDKGIVTSTTETAIAQKMTGSKALAVMTIRSSEVAFGVGSANYDEHPSRKVAASVAVQKAIADAGRNPDQIPQAIIVSPRGDNEVEDIAGIESIVGTEVPVLGGLRSFSMTATQGDVSFVDNGLSLAVLYTDLPVGYTFQGGYRVKDLRTGVITKRKKDVIYEIDHRPAYTVFDEWLNGEITRLLKAGDHKALDRLMLLNPLCQQFMTDDHQSYFLFGVGQPNQDELSLKANFKIQTNDRIYLSQGNWEYLLNSIGRLPKLAKTNAGLGSEEDLVLAIGHLCAGVMSLVPDGEKDKITVLLNHSSGRAPMIASITLGEQGYFPGVGNKAGHLLYSFLVIGARR